jgi:hypothetical protein
MTPKDEEVCLCGDYRSNHRQNGNGPCQICEYAGPTRCHRFRLWDRTRTTGDDKP